jgi:hypothetical protein
MPRPLRLGIIGGYGSTGGVVVSELWKSCPGEILFGGRDLAKAKELAATFDGRVSAAQVDVLDAASLDRFCSNCSIIVNCGGPVMQLQNRVAQAALRNRCHYVDLAGLTMVKERLLLHDQEIRDQSLSFVVSAGWLPGLTELLPVYAYIRAKAQLDAIESLTVYFGDSGEWSTSAYQDMAWYLRHVGLGKPGYFRRGERVSVGMLHASPLVDLGTHIGRQRFSLQSLPEQDEVAHRLKDCDVFIYSYLPGIRVALTSVLVALLPLPNGLAVRLLQSAFRRTSLPVGGFVVAKVRGHSQGSQVTLTAEAIFAKQRDYWINGLVISTVTRMLAEGNGVRPGVHFLADAVEPIAFMAELQKHGLELTEHVEPVDEESKRNAHVL